MNLNENLTTHFKLKEFTKTDVSRYQLGLIKVLAGQLELLRCHLNEKDEFKKDKSKSISITITSGLRTIDDYNRLKAKGYHPSANSDHFFDSKPGTFGAADCIFGNLNVSLFELFEYIVKLDQAQHVFFGQILYELNPKTKSEWIHISNDPYYIFRSSVLQNATERSIKYGYSKDNGLTFTKYTPKLGND